MLDTFFKVARPFVFLSALALRIHPAERIFLGVLVLAADAINFKNTLGEVHPVHPLLANSTLTTILLQSLDVWDLLFLTKDPQTFFRKVGRDYSTQSLPIIERYKWAASILFSPRRLGTNAQIPNIPSYNGPTSRIDFALHNIRLLAAHTLRLASLWLTHIPNKNYYPILLNQPPAETLFTLAFRRSAAAATILITAYVLIDTSYLVASTVATLLGFTEAKDWPDIWGDFSQATTVRKCWG